MDTEEKQNQNQDQINSEENKDSDIQFSQIIQKDDLYQLLELYKFLHNDEKFDNAEHLKDVWQNNNSVIFTDKLQNVDYYFKNIFEQLEELELMWNKYDKIIEEEKNNLILKDI